MGKIAGPTITDVDDPPYSIILSTAKTGATGSEKPDLTGEYVSFFAEDWEFLDDPKDRKKDLGNFKSSKVLMGKTSRGIMALKVWVGPQDGVTLTVEMKNIRDYIRTHGEKPGASKIYCFIFHNSENAYQYLGWDSSHNPVRYYYGHPVPTHWKTLKGKLMQASRFIFDEVNI